MMLIRCVILALLLMLSWVSVQQQTAHAQVHRVGESTRSYVHDVWQTEEGLPHNAINAISQTRDGYLWLGTAGGLVRFDGVRFVAFGDEQSVHLQNSYIWALHEDHEGGLWIGSGNGLSRLGDGIVNSYTTAEGLSNNFVRAICQDQEGTLWIGTYGGGLNRLHEGQFTPYTMEMGLADDFVNALHEDRAGTLWVGTGSGLSRFEDGHFTTYATPEGLSDDDVRAIFEDREGTLWIGTGDGLYRFVEERFVAVPDERGAPLGAVRTIYQDREGILWVGTEASGLIQLQHDKPAPYTATGEVSHNDVRGLYQDQEGSLWIGTNGGGLNRFKRGRFTVYGTEEGLPNNVAFSVYQDQHGAAWVGTNGGLSRLDDGRLTTYTTKDGLSNAAVFSLAEDNQGGLWVGTNGGGLNRFSEGRFTTYSTEDGLTDDVIFALYEDRQEALWIGTGGGLNRYKDGTFTSYTRADGLAEGLVVALLEDRQGTLWIGTDTGLSRFKKGVFNTYTTDDGLSSNFIRALYEDEEGTLWIGTRGGLNRLRDNTITSYTTRQGLFSNVIYGILEDEVGNLWMSSDRSLFRVRKQELDALARGETASVTSVTYGKTDGMRSSESVGGMQPSGWKMNDGRLWFPTLDGVVVVAPNDIQTNTQPPHVHTEELVVNDTLVVHQDGALLPPSAERFEFRYTGLSYLTPDKVTFKYKLEPNDADWIDAGTQRSATYTNLAPGAYTFRVLASNNDGVWNDVGDTLLFTVRPYFYQTAWFGGLCVLLFLMLGVGLYTLRVRHLKTREKELVRLVNERTWRLMEEKEKTEAQAQTLEEQARKLVDLDRARSEFFANISHEFRTPLTLILGPLEDLLAEEKGPLTAENRRHLHVALRNAQRLLQLINQLLNFSKLDVGKMAPTPTWGNVADFVKQVVLSFSALADREQIMLQYAADTEDIPLCFDHDLLEKVVSNLLSNALKFTREGGKVRVWVGITHQEGSSDHTASAPATHGRDGYVEIVVKDTGCGIAKADLPHVFDRFRQARNPLNREQEGTGIGLALVKELVDVHGGDLTVNSELGFGSTFTVRLPLISFPGEKEIKEGLSDGAGEKKEADLLDVDKETPYAALEGTGPGRPRTRSRTPKILVVEDQPDVRAYVKQHLEGTYEIIEATNGVEGVKKATTLLPDLVISDVMMPDLDGYGLCAQLRKEERTRSIPIILLTAKATEEGTLQGLHHGADDYIYKPFSVRELKARVQNLITRREDLRQRYRREVFVKPGEVTVLSLDEAFLQRAIERVEANMANPTFSVDALAAEMSLSRRQLQRKLRDLAGQSPSDFIRHLRLQRAAQLLEQEAGTVSEIAYAIGFKKPAYFSELFRKTFGTSPSEYPRSE